MNLYARNFALHSFAMERLGGHTVLTAGAANQVGGRAEAVARGHQSPELVFWFNQYISSANKNLFIKKRLRLCFSCVHMHIYKCMLAFFRQAEQSEWFTQQESLACSTAWVCLFPCQYQQNHRWQRARRGGELHGQTQASLSHTRDSSQLSSCIMRTRAPGRPCHPGKY